VQGEPLRRRLLLLVAAGVVPLAAMAGISLLVLTQQQRLQAEQAGREVTRALATAVDAELGRSIAVLKAVAISPALDTGDLARYHQTMRRLLVTRPDWVSITLADVTGQQLANTRVPFGEPLPMVLDLPTHHETVRTKEPLVGALLQSPLGAIALPVRVPVVRDGVVRYVLTAAVKPDAFVDVLQRQRLPADWVVSVFDGKAQRVARSRRHAEFLMQPPSPSLADMIRRAQDDQGSGLTEALEGDAIHTAFTRSRATGWIVAIGIPRAAVEAGAWKSFAAYGGGLLLSLAVGALAAVLVGRGIAEPMARLRAAAQALGRRATLAVPETRILEIREVGSALATAAAERAAHEAEREELLLREQQARAAAERASRAKDEFLAMLGHELRNPLGALSNASSLLQDPRSEPELARRAQQIVVRQVEQLRRLTDDLLDAGRAMLGKIVLHRAPLDLAAASAGVLDTLEAAGRFASHDVRRELATAWVDADFTRVEQVVSNLVGNALKYTPARGTITVRVSPEGHEAVLTVADDGAGMPPDLVGRVFEAFVQGERDLDRAHGGLGIGLTLVRRLAELHGGSASAASPGPGNGSVFQVRFPSIAAPAASAENKTAQTSEMPRDILIIEDNADAAATLRSLLQLAGHRVRVARDGPEGLEALKTRIPDVALIDLGLPRIDGYEVARRAREMIEGQPRPMLIAVTGYGLPEDRRRTLEAGFDAHLVKPVDLAALRALLAQASAGSRSSPGPR
jgi:signal transduction histidine kinase/ActR/RegA family two-component response regulator